MIIKFVISTLKSTLVIRSFSVLPFFIMLFGTILTANLVGMIPSATTITSYFVITFYWSFGTFIGTNIIGLFRSQIELFVLFLPGGVPITITPLLILIEYVSYISRIFSLAIRLFANMTAGHILFKILIFFLWAYTTAPGCPIFRPLVILPVSCIICAIILLELAIAFLQAYVFLALSSIYLNDVLHTH